MIDNDSSDWLYVENHTKALVVSKANPKHDSYLRKIIPLTSNCDYLFDRLTLFNTVCELFMNGVRLEDYLMEKLIVDNNVTYEDVVYYGNNLKLTRESEGWRLNSNELCNIVESKDKAREFKLYSDLGKVFSDYYPLFQTRLVSDPILNLFLMSYYIRTIIQDFGVAHDDWYRVQHFKSLLWGITIPF